MTKLMIFLGLLVIGYIWLLVCMIRATGQMWPIIATFTGFRIFFVFLAAIFNLRRTWKPLLLIFLPLFIFALSGSVPNLFEEVIKSWEQNPIP